MKEIQQISKQMKIECKQSDIKPTDEIVSSIVVICSQLKMYSMHGNLDNQMFIRFQYHLKTYRMMTFA